MINIKLNAGSAQVQIEGSNIVILAELASILAHNKLLKDLVIEALELVAEKEIKDNFENKTSQN